MLAVDFDPGQLKAKDVMQYGVIYVAPDDSVAKAASLIIGRCISGLPVVQNGRPIGILSDKDLLRLVGVNGYLPGCVEEYMTNTAYCFDVDDSISDICKYLSEQPFRRVPILHEGRLAGMITRSDLVNLYREGFRPQDQSDLAIGEGDLQAQHIMQGGIITVNPSTTLYVAMSLLSEHHLTGLPVVDREERLVGVITETDLLRRAVLPRRSDCVIETCMTRSVVSVARQASFVEVCGHLIENDFHLLPVLDGERLVGVIQRSDILRRRMATFRL